VILFSRTPFLQQASKDSNIQGYNDNPRDLGIKRHASKNGIV